jgi:Uma2 family endonuclease
MSAFEVQAVPCYSRLQVRDMTVQPSIRRSEGLMTVKDFLAFLEPRPHRERWELVDGVATMMTPPTMAHQRIATNLQSLLNAHFAAIGSELFAYQETGACVEGLDNFMPSPDVSVVPGVAGNDYFSTVSRMVAEVLSPSNTKRYIARKIDHYRINANCLHVLVVESRSIGAELHSRGDDWTVQHFKDPAAMVSLSGLGISFALGELYRGTFLDSAKR